MTINKVRLKKLPAILFIEEDNSLLLFEPRGELVTVSPLTTIILLTCEKKGVLADNLQHLSDQLTIPLESINEEYSKLLATFSGGKGEDSYLDGRYPELDIELDKTVTAPSELSHYLLIAGSGFLIDTNCKVLSRAIQHILAPLISSYCPPDFFLEVIHLDGFYHIHSNGILAVKHLSYEEVMPELVDRLQIVSYQATPYLFCFHGAAIQQGQSIYLLPGESGKGKSTLCAEIQNSNSTTFSDEFIVLDEELNLTEIKLPLAIKSGSWEQLSGKYPCLKEEQEWRRLDGRLIKYVWPINRDKENNVTKVAKVHIIFPQFGVDLDDKGASLTKLTVVDTIQLLTRGGYQLSADLDELTLDKLFSYIENSTRMSLSYSSTSQALKALGLPDE
ncbi:hypothetical protein HII17_18780 [Thalassotalea sp. M1531]|uniref:PqqD family peptide modification chaperone n=1 Tax=Thalassotalea algicola TaxID=2716224 RepID=A0A7Y0LHZ6_9GAMM|nr:hypothetical protein [Thalassotalea algicola]NMP33595.1 hypothetical protein [Thalassotalea algicola]